MLRLAGNVDGFVLVLLWLLAGWVGFEPGGLLFGELGGGLAEVADGFEGDLAGDVVGLVVGWGLDGGGPAFGGFEELGQGFADVGVTRAVVVEVVGELVADGGKLFDEVVGVLLAAGTAGLGVEVVDLLGAEVEELDEEDDAIVGDKAAGTDLLDLAFGESGLMGLCVEGRGEEEDSDRERETAEERARDLGCTPKSLGHGQEGIPQGLKPISSRRPGRPKPKGLGYLEARTSVSLESGTLCAAC
jgi:hypothetical protein